MSSASFAAPGATSETGKARRATASTSGAATGSSRRPSGEHTASRAELRFVAFVRRTADITVGSLALAALAPAFAVIAGLIKATSPGPIFYGQTRVGKNWRVQERRASGEPESPSDRRRRSRRKRMHYGRPFEILKFRSMVVNAEEYGPQWSTKDDPRITSVGRVLRKTRLDETPQFWNVLRGDMTLIGPRPERPYFVQQFVEQIPNYTQRLDARPGITGHAQVSLDYDVNLEDVRRKLELDLDYLRDRSLGRDMRILARTIWVVLTGKGAL